MTHALLQTEVIVQDHFFAGSSTDFPEIPDDRPAAPVSTATWEHWFQCWLSSLHSELPPSTCYELSVRLTNDAEIQSLNAQYRHKNQPTDVLAFAALEVDYPQLEECEFAETEDTSLYLGDVVISVETAQRQATQLGHSLQQELAWLASHALLHLLGWDHPDKASMLCMLKQQETLLQTVGLSIDYHQVENLIQQEYSDTEPCNL